MVPAVATALGWPTAVSEKPSNSDHLNSPREFDEPLIGAHIMTTTKATGALAVLESGFRIIPGKETDFLAYQAEVVPLGTGRFSVRLQRPGF
jgi:hypothetical protein